MIVAPLLAGLSVADTEYRERRRTAFAEDRASRGAQPGGIMVFADQRRGSNNDSLAHTNLC